MNGTEGARQPINLVDLIDRLVEPPEPAPVSMMPETAGWTVFAVLLLFALAWLLWRWLRRRRANAYRRAALAELAAAGDDPVAVAAILRRTALAAWPRERVASLAGRGWLQFLDDTLGGDGPAGGFVDGAGAVIAEAPYQRAAAPAPGLGVLAARWVRRHRAGAGPAAAP